MGQQLIIAPSARSDLHDIVQAIARDAPGRAVKFGDALLDRAQQAADFPLSGRIVPELQKTAPHLVTRLARCLYHAISKQGEPG